MRARIRANGAKKLNLIPIGVSAAITAFALTGGNLAAQDDVHYIPGKIGGTLGPPEQIARDRLAIRIFNSAPVQREMHKLEVIYAADPTGALPDATLTLKRAAAATAMAQSVTVVNQDPDRPIAYWSITSPHAWGDLKVPLAGLMVDDTDNIYRSIPIDTDSNYEIRGKVMGTPPAQETFTLHNVMSGASKDQKVRKQEEEAGFVALDQLTVGKDGSFTITVDSSPVAGRTNHIQSTPGVHDGYILVRDTLVDWSRESPVKLSVRRVSGPAMRPPRSEDELAEKAAALIASGGPYWLAWAHNVFFSHPANIYSHIITRASGWGFIKCGHYDLKDDEALVVTVDRKRAAYLGFQLSDVWGQGQAANQIEGTASLNGSQAQPNADGTYSYAISLVDPGIHNWLNPDGLHAGTFCTRWQNLPAGVPADDAVRLMKVLKIKDLKTVFVAGSDWLTPVQRREQLKEHRASYLRRLD